MITMRPVDSSNIASEGYDPAQGILRITFKSGGTYDYHGVDVELYAAFSAAPSKGEYLAKVIKPGHPVAKVG